MTLERQVFRSVASGSHSFFFLHRVLCKSITKKKSWTNYKLVTNSHKSEHKRSTKNNLVHNLPKRHQKPKEQGVMKRNKFTLNDWTIHERRILRHLNFRHKQWTWTPWNLSFRHILFHEKLIFWYWQMWLAGMLPSYIFLFFPIYSYYLKKSYIFL